MTRVSRVTHQGSRKHPCAGIGTSSGPWLCSYPCLWTELKRVSWISYPIDDKDPPLRSVSHKDEPGHLRCSCVCPVGCEGLWAPFPTPVKTSSCDKDPGAVTHSGFPQGSCQGTLPGNSFLRVLSWPCGQRRQRGGHSTHLVPTSALPWPHRDL